MTQYLIPNQEENYKRGDKEHTEATRNAKRILAWKPEGNKLFERSWLRWKYNIKMSTKQAGCEHFDRMKLAQIKV
jgi:hypothetical protein